MGPDDNASRLQVVRKQDRERHQVSTGGSTWKYLAVLVWGVKGGTQGDTTQNI
jgi:hypothetical protein